VKTPISVGYLRPREGVIRVNSWLLVDERRGTAELPDALPDWDYQQDVKIICTLDANLRSVRGDSDLPATAVIRAHVQWHATGTGLRGASTPVELNEGTTAIELCVRGEQLSGTLNLEARVALGSLGGPPISPLAAHRPGAVLWTGVRRTQLEGAGTRFPITALSFANTGIAGGRNAAWCLKLESYDLADSASGSLRVYLNTDNERIRAYLRQPDLPLAEQFTRNLRFGVTRQLLSVALEHEDLDIQALHDAGSLGELLTALLDRTFPNREITELRLDLRRDPGEFEAELQARTGYEP
jgi:hypothetical protein